LWRGYGLATRWRESSKSTKAVCVGGGHGNRVTGIQEARGLAEAWRLCQEPESPLNIESSHVRIFPAESSDIQN
jgi:hypothetical protein